MKITAQEITCYMVTTFLIRSVGLVYLPMVDSYGACKCRYIYIYHTCCTFIRYPEDLWIKFGLP